MNIYEFSKETLKIQGIYNNIINKYIETNSNTNDEIINCAIMALISLSNVQNIIQITNNIINEEEGIKIIKEVNKKFENDINFSGKEDPYYNG
jgi:hypothetical protein